MQPKVIDYRFRLAEQGFVLVPCVAVTSFLEINFLSF